MEYHSASFFADPINYSFKELQAKNIAPAVFTNYSRNLFQPMSKQW
jgi:hypothetical protein